MFITMKNDMKQRYRVFLRPWGVYYCEDLVTGKQGTLKTRDKNEAYRLVAAKNETAEAPAFSLHLARVYWKAGDPAAATRTWQSVMDEILKLKNGNTHVRWQTAIKDPAFDLIRNLVVLETRPEHFLRALENGTVCTNIFLRRIQNFALDMSWLPWPVLAKKRWPKIEFKDKRGIMAEEHQKILAGEQNPEWRAYYQLLWHLGGSQSDVAALRAEDIDWEMKVISFNRMKTGSVVQLHFGEALESLLNDLPSEGFLVPHIAEMKESDRAKAFIRRCKLVSVSGVSLHSYRYAWAERAKACGYPERFAMQNLGHNSKAVARMYAKKAKVMLPPLEAYERKQTINA
jgi:integrase